MVVDPVIGPDEKLARALELMRGHGISGLPVVDDGRPVGILTNRDIRFERNLEQRVAQVMNDEAHHRAGGFFAGAVQGAPTKIPHRKADRHRRARQAARAHHLGRQARYNQLRQQVMEETECSKRTAQLAIAEACRQGSIVQADGQYRLPL